MKLTAEEELNLPDPLHWTRTFNAAASMASVKVRLGKRVDTAWRWSFLGGKPKKAYYGHVHDRRFIIHNTPGFTYHSTLRLIGEWSSDTDMTIRIRFSWHSIYFLVSITLITLLLIVVLYFKWAYQVLSWMPLLVLAFFGLFSLVGLVPVWLEYRSALVFLKKDLGLVMTSKHADVPNTIQGEAPKR